MGLWLRLLVSGTQEAGAAAPGTHLALSAGRQGLTVTFVGPEIEASAGMRHHKASWQPHAGAQLLGLLQAGNVRRASVGGGVATEVSLGHCQPEIPRLLFLLGLHGPKVKAGFVAPKRGVCSRHPSFLPILSLLRAPSRSLHYSCLRATEPI